jgi:O-antigen/teichoic acid export membrane protein
VLFKNTLAQSSSLVTGYVFSFLLAPLMLAKLGLTNFGIWAVTGGIVGYLGLLDLGITRALSRFVALYDSRGDRHLIGECVGLGLIAVTFVGSVAMLFAIFASPWAAGVVKHISGSDMRIVLMSSASILTTQFYEKVLRSVPIGLRRMVAPNVASNIGAAINFGFSAGILLISPSLTNYAVANAAAEGLGLVATVIGVLYVTRPIPVAMPARARGREILKYGLKVQLAWIADLVNLQTDKLILTVMLGVRVAGAYEIASRISAAVKSIGIQTISAMVPTATAHIVKHGRASVPAFYKRYTRLTVSISFPIVVLTSVAAPLFLATWLGESPAHTAAIVAALNAANTLSLATGVGTTVASADDRAGLWAGTALLSAVLNVVLTASLSPVFGLAGVLSGTAIAIASGSLLFTHRFHRAYAMPFREFVTAAGQPLALALVLGAPILVWRVVGTVPNSRGPAALELLAACIYYLVSYWIAASWLSFLPRRLAFRWIAPRGVRTTPVVATSGE